MCQLPSRMGGRNMMPMRVVREHSANRARSKHITIETKDDSDEDHVWNLTGRRDDRVVFHCLL